jgi:deoxyribonuclease-4
MTISRYAAGMLLGAHESVAGGAFTAIQRGREDGCEAIQIFARPSAQWKAKPFDAQEVSLFRSEHAQVGWPVMSHGSYLINLCATDPIILDRSRVALEEELTRAEELGLDYVVLHPGAHLGAGERDGIATIAESLGHVHQRTRGLRVRLLIEITAGQGSCLGCRFEHLEALLSQARGGEQIGICIDTCHLHASGYDLSTEEGYDRAFGELDRIVGLDRVKAFHLNDSKTPAGSRVDRHAEIGDGYLGLLPFWRLVNDPRFARIPGVLETPSGPDKLPSFKRNLERLRALIGAPRPAGPPKDQSPPEDEKAKKKKKDTQQTTLFG